MSTFVVSVRNNTLLVSAPENVDEATSVKLDASVVKGSEIVDVSLFAEQLGQTLLENFPPSKKQSLTFLVEPENLLLSFLTDTKKSKDSETYLMNEAQKRLAAKALTFEDVYFSYQKIAPFVYQFVAIKKDVLEKYLEITSLLGIELRSVIPWAMLLPKFVESSGEPQIFVLNMDNAVTLALSELSGVYHQDFFKEEEEMAKLKDLINDVSIFERSTPIKKMYTHNLPGFEVGENIETEGLGISSTHSLYYKGFTEDLLTTQINLLTLLPVPEVSNKPSALVYAGSAVASALIIVAAIYGFNMLKANDVNNSEVLSENQQVTKVEETQESTSQEEQETKEESETSEEETQDEVNSDLNKEYLRIRVENGTQLAGLAGRTRDHLNPFGYDITNVADSERSDVETTLVEFTKQTVIYKDLLEKDLKEMFENIEIKETLVEGLDYDVLITAGTNEKVAE